MKTYAGKTALVTGASSGIGRAIAEDLAGRGANLILVARSKAELDTLAAELAAKRKIRADVVAMDLAADGAPRRLFDEVGRLGLSVDVLVNNAGFGRWGRFLDDDVATLSQMMALNMQALVELCHVFLPAMAARGEGGILNVGSTASFIPVPWSAVYGATKAFVLSFSEALHYEYKGRVTVTALCPGDTATRFASVANARAKGSGPSADSPESVAKVGLDALLEGRAVVISGRSNQQVAFLPRLLPRATVLRIAGETWKKRLASRGVTVS